MSNSTETAASIAGKLAPPGAVVVLDKATSIPIADWVQWAMLAYVILLIIGKAWHLLKEWRTGWRGPDSEGDLP